MSNLLSTLLYIFSMLAPISGNEDGKGMIVGGVESEVGRYPYMVSVTDGRGTRFCQAALISSGYALTAAHCSGRGVYLEIGRHDIFNKEDDYEKIPIAAEISHPNYCPDTKDYDFMVIKLGTESKFSPVALAQGNTNVAPGTDVTVMGWGEKYYGGPTSTVLMEVELDVIDSFWCENLYSGVNEITGTMLCASREGKDSCQGDSGGPLIKKGADGEEDILIGITSFGVYCADPSYPGVYARVTAAKSWIKEIVQNGGRLTMMQRMKYSTARLFNGDS